MTSTPKKIPLAMERKPKTIYQLDSPFTTVSWPETSPQNQESILELLCSILSPIGQHRSNHVIPSKGKRSKKRGRTEEKAKAESGAKAADTPSMPPTPEISSHILVGLNSITRHLEALSEASKPAATTDNQKGPQAQPDSEVKPHTEASNSNIEHSKLPTIPAEEKRPTLEHIAAIFIPSSPQPTILQAHLPQLAFTASLVHPTLPSTRIVQLPTGSNARLCEALGLPRVSFIGILERAPHTKALIELVRETVPEIDVPWLREVREEKYLKVKINAVETFASTPVVVGKEKKSV